MAGYTIILKVCNLKGHRPAAKIIQVNSEKNRIQVAASEEVLKDKPPFLKNGRIDFTYNRADHKKAIAKVTKYLEDIYMLELANEDNNTSHKTGTKSGGSKTTSKSRTATAGKGKSTDTLHNSGGRTEPTEGDRRGVKSTELDKGSDKVGSSKASTENKTVSKS